MPQRPRRSVLYMPGANARALEKARSLPADALILDLEDAVAPDAKDLARSQIVAALDQGGYARRELLVRVNSPATPWGYDDIAAIARCSMHGVVIPKVETPAQIIEVSDALDKAGAAPDLPLWAMVETPRGVLNIEAVADAHPRLQVIVMGTSDLAKELRVRHTPERTGLLASLSLCVLTARAHRRDILDGVFLDLADEQGFQTACRQGRDLGFDGKTLIHPKQIACANETFGPAPEEVERSLRILDAWDQVRREGKGVAVVDDRLVEILHVDEARRILDLAEAIEANATAL